MERKYYNSRDIANYLGLSEHTIRAWTKRGKIPYCRFGRAVRFDITKVEPWIKNKEFHP